MINKYPKGLFLFLLVTLLSVAQSSEQVDVYFIGNSLTMSTTLDRVHELADQQGVDLQFGSQLSGGKSLIRHLNYKEEPNQKWKSWETNVPSGETYEPDENMYVIDSGELQRFGLHDVALADHDWDKVVFQLYGGTLHDDLKAISAFVDLTISKGKSPEFLIYSTWPQRRKMRQEDGSMSVQNIDYIAAWESEYTASADDTDKKSRWNYASRSYVAQLMAELRSRFPDEQFRLIPTGEVIYALDTKIKSGALPGLSELAAREPALVPGLDTDTGFQDGANVLYADAIHFNPKPHQMNSLGIFVSGTCLSSALSKKSPLGLSAESYGLDDTLDAELIQAIQQTIQDVFEANPDSSF